MLDNNNVKTYITNSKNNSHRLSYIHSNLLLLLDILEQHNEHDSIKYDVIDQLNCLTKSDKEDLEAYYLMNIFLKRMIYDYTPIYVVKDYLNALINRINDIKKEPLN